MISNLFNTEDINKYKLNLVEMTPERYLNMKPIEKLEFHISLGLLEMIGEIKEVTEVLSKLTCEEVIYKYKVIRNENQYFMRTKEEVCDFFKESNIHKIWSDYRRGELGAEIYKINEKHFYTKGGERVYKASA